MSRPLPPGDPVQLGPFRLSARLSETSAGIVYLGEDHEGRRASVAVLTRGAAGDAAARDRFRAAITASLPGPGRPPEFDPAGPAPVVAAHPDGPAPWVAVDYDVDRPDRLGAERFLDSVLLEGSFRGRRAGQVGRRRGPQFQPYWLGAGGPALERPPAPPPVPAPAERSARGLVSAILTLAAVLVVLALLMLVLFACQPEAEDPPPPPPEPTLQTPTPSPDETTEAPSPTPTPSPSDTAPSPSPGDGDDGGGPL
ncbi:hypothetical protein [Spirillospora sp. NPDC047279]|uniref:hypothetical protein n=1 Tax=Spirillospora sp. NPDC047279 TaxID=3155478 RepID=UPI0033D57058